jgi:hypothetical protein
MREKERRKNMYIFRYKIKVYSEEDGFKIYQGVLFADCYEDAMSLLVEQYGEKEIEDILCLRTIADGAVIPFPDEEEYVIDKIEENWIW